MQPADARIVRLLAIAALACGALACERFDDTPRVVAGSFWAALAAGDFAEAQRISTASGEAPLREFAEELPVENLRFGEILRGEQSALVETRATERSRSRELRFNTHLQRSGDGWRVDLRETRRDLRRAAIAASFEEVQDALSESADQLVEQFEKRALEASEALREALRELERSLRGEEEPST